MDAGLTWGGECDPKYGEDVLPATAAKVFPLRFTLRTKTEIVPPPPPFVSASAISASVLLGKSPLTGEKASPPHGVLQVAIPSVHCRKEWTQSQNLAVLSQVLSPFYLNSPVLKGSIYVSLA